MIRIFAFVLMAAMFTMCADEKIKVEEKTECLTRATVVDLSDLDGCGFVLRLEDGTNLIPYRILFCGTPPLPPEIEKDPLNNFQLINGMKVMINYEPLNDLVTACMAGPVVKVTCISEARQQWEL